MGRGSLVLDPEGGLAVLKGLASPIRARILKVLHVQGPLSGSEIAERLEMPQSTVWTNLQILETAGLIRIETEKSRNGRVCHPNFDEILVAFSEELKPLHSIEVNMPLGLYSSCEVSVPCGLCSLEGGIGSLNEPSVFLNPERMKAGLIWFTRGYLEYQFPNNAKLGKRKIEAIEFSMELSSEVPGTSADWPSDITLSVNGTEIGNWTSPGDFGDKRGVYTPDWWKLKGSQYGKLKIWRVTQNGTYVDGMKISPVSLGDLDLTTHHSIRLRIAVKDDAKHPGGVNIFGRGFGNYDQDIIMRLQTER